MFFNRLSKKSQKIIKVVLDHKYYTKATDTNRNKAKEVLDELMEE